MNKATIEVKVKVNDRGTNGYRIVDAVWCFLLYRGFWRSDSFERDLKETVPRESRCWCVSGWWTIDREYKSAVEGLLHDHFTPPSNGWNSNAPPSVRCCECNGRGHFLYPMSTPRCTHCDGTGKVPAF